MLVIYRRHRADCKKTKRRADCCCPVWAQGLLWGERIRKSLGVTSWKAAQKIAWEWEMDGVKEIPTFDVAGTRFINDMTSRGLSPDTIKKFELLTGELNDYFPNRQVDRVTADEVAKFREQWKFSPSTTRKKLERLRSFFKFCMARKWIDENPAVGLRAPREISIERKPFEKEELERIEAAIPLFPIKGIYGEGNRVRIKAFVSLLRWTGLRIRDAVKLRREMIADGYLILRTQKNGKPVKIPLHSEINLPQSGEYLFWSGEGNIKSCVGDWQRTLRRLGDLADVHIHAHRYRHTFAAELLSRGVPVSEVAAILGNSPRIVEKHYSQWIETRQKAIDSAVRLAWGSAERFV